MSMEKGMGSIVIMLMTAIVGIALLVAIASGTNYATALQNTTNESFSGINGTPVKLAHNQVQTLGLFRDINSSVLPAGYYTVNLLAGTVQTNLTSTYYADYTWKNVSDAASSSVTSLILIMTAISLLAGMLYALMPSLKEIM